MTELQRQRSPRWETALAAVLMMATFLNYANRFTITQTAPLIKRDLRLTNEDYGTIEAGFGYAFAIGALVFGAASDLVSVRLLYPIVVLAWSAAGLSSGLVEGFWPLWTTRVVLGFFEAGHWSCAWRTTQRIFAPELRTRANGVLQSGASMGAVWTPLLVATVVTGAAGSWRSVFWIVGVLGVPWSILWLACISETDLRRPVMQTTDDGNGESARVLDDTSFLEVFFQQRFWVLFGTVLCINTCWHYIRVWMPLTLNEDHGYSLAFVNYFTSAYYLATFAGCLGAGWLTAHLTRRQWRVHQSRLATFFLCSVLTGTAVLAAASPRGPLLLGSLLVVAFGSLGLFPVYYTLVQEISAKHQGKVAGTLAFSTWFTLGQIHPWIGRAVDRDPDIRPYIFATVGLLPIFALALIWLFWRQPRTRPSDGKIR